MNNAIQIYRLIKVAPKEIEFWSEHNYLNVARDHRGIYRYKIGFGLRKFLMIKGVLNTSGGLNSRI